VWEAITRLAQGIPQQGKRPRRRPVGCAIGSPGAFLEDALTFLVPGEGLATPPMPRLQNRQAGAIEPADQLPNGIPTASARAACGFRERAAIRHGKQGLGPRDVCRWLIVAPTDGEQALPFLVRARVKRLVWLASHTSLHCYESSDRGV
jgi:hypothetical protein